MNWYIYWCLATNHACFTSHTLAVAHILIVWILLYDKIHNQKYIMFNPLWNVLKQLSMCSTSLALTTNSIWYVKWLHAQWSTRYVVLLGFNNTAAASADRVHSSPNSTSWIWRKGWLRMAPALPKAYLFDNSLFKYCRYVQTVGNSRPGASQYVCNSHTLIWHDDLF
jgi:hypothetical protein